MNQDFTATFEGNDHTVSNLYINLSTTGANGGNYAGLFADLATTGAIRNVGLVNPYVSNRRGGAGFGRTGALAGRNNGGVSGSYVSGGSVTSNQSAVAGIIYNMAGCLLGYNAGTVSDSYATCAVTATGADDAVDIAGGLVGWSAGTVRDSYATGTVAGDAKAGGLVGFSNAGGRVSGSHATGAVSTSGAGGHAGGLVGHSAGESAVTGSYATGAVSASGSGSYAGGLAGLLSTGGTGEKTVRASYATGAVSASGTGSYVGGLTGQIQRDFSIVASYATGAVSASGGGTNLGGLVGNLSGRGASVTNSYWDTSTSGRTASAAGLGKTTSELQSPMGYAGIYAGWNLNLDGLAGNDDPWYFGVANQYPVLQYGGNDLHIQLAGDYDWDDDGLIEVSGLAQLYAIHWDLDGNGVVDTGTSAANTAARTAQYDAAFPGAIAHMGCRRDHDANAETDKVDGCIGYELTRDLDFDTDGDGATYTISSTGVVTGDAGDAYYNRGFGWTPIGIFTATFDGNNKTIANLFIKSTWASGIGLFRSVGTGGRVERLGVRDVNVNYSQYISSSVGGLAGSNYGTISASYATGSIISFRWGGHSEVGVGGLVGSNYGTIIASYATGSVNYASWATGSVNYGGFAPGSTTGTGRSGAVGAASPQSAATASYWNIASYATGPSTVTGQSFLGYVGGLVGKNYRGTISASYTTGSVTGGNWTLAGGLTGSNYQGTITASYATGSVTGHSGDTHLLVGGLSGSNYQGTITASYWDTGTTGQSTSAGGTGKTTRELQSPTGYTGIYANWNANLDGMAGNDDPWDFGSNRQYPALKYGGLDPFLQRPVSVSVQSVNRNIPIVGGPVTATLDTTGLTGITWQWQSSSNGSTWTDIANATGAAYIPVVADAAGGGKFLRVKVSFTAWGKSRTLTSGSTTKVVSNATVPATPAAAAPIVGEKLRYYLSAAGATHRTAWQWRRCDDVLMRTHCKLITQSNSASDAHTEYTPVAGTDTDVGKYLQAYVYYAANDAGKTWTRAESPVLGPVVAAPAPATSP